MITTLTEKWCVLQSCSWLKMHVLHEDHTLSPPGSAALRFHLSYAMIPFLWPATGGTQAAAAADVVAGKLEESRSRVKKS